MIFILWLLVLSWCVASTYVKRRAAIQFVDEADEINWFYYQKCADEESACDI